MARSARPLVLRGFFLAAALLLALPAPLIAAQSQSGNNSGQPPQPAPSVNYTQPQPQPALDVDRDPIASPDYEAPIAPQVPGQQISKAANNLYTLQENVNEVLLNCTVVDQQNRLVKGLRASDFRIWEDGVPQHIASFINQDVPVSMGILIDDSGSMIGKRQTANQAALDLIQDSNSQDDEFIVNFNQNAYLDTALTSNVDTLRAGLAHFEDRGETALYDAIAASADNLAQHANRPRQVILIITDGADDASRLTLQQAIQHVQRLGGPVVYSIGLLYNDYSRSDAQQSRQTLETLAADTGGLAFFPNSPADIGRVVAQIALDIRNQYTLGYHPTRSPSLGGFRRVHVEVRDRRYKHLIVRTTTGYYPRQIAGMHANEKAEIRKAPQP